MSDDDKFDDICNKAQAIIGKINDDIESVVKDMNALQRSAFMAAISGHLDFQVVRLWARHHKEEYVPDRKPHIFRKSTDV